jgi:hypothetical protein
MIQRQRKTAMNTKEYIRKTNGMVPPTYDMSQRSMSVQHLDNIDYAHENNYQNNAPILNNINLNVNKKVCVNINTNQQTPRLIPSISVSSDMSSVNNVNENSMNENINSSHSMFSKFKRFFRQPSKSPTPESDEARSKFYMTNNGNNDQRHGHRTLSGGGSSSLSGKVPGSNFSQSKSLQEKNQNTSLSFSNSDLVNGCSEYKNDGWNNSRSLKPAVTIVNNLPKRAEKFFYDKETKAEIKRMFEMLPVQGILKF